MIVVCKKQVSSPGQSLRRDPFTHYMTLKYVMPITGLCEGLSKTGGGFMIPEINQNLETAQVIGKEQPSRSQ